MNERNRAECLSDTSVTFSDALNTVSLLREYGVKVRPGHVDIAEIQSLITGGQIVGLFQEPSVADPTYVIQTLPRG